MMCGGTTADDGSTGTTLIGLLNVLGAGALALGCSDAPNEEQPETTRLDSDPAPVAIAAPIEFDMRHCPSLDLYVASWAGELGAVVQPFDERLAPLAERLATRTDELKSIMQIDADESWPLIDPMPWFLVYSKEPSLRMPIDNMLQDVEASRLIDLPGMNGAVLRYWSAFRDFEQPYIDLCWPPINRRLERSHEVIQEFLQEEGAVVLSTLAASLQCSGHPQHVEVYLLGSGDVSDSLMLPLENGQYAILLLVANGTTPRDVLCAFLHEASHVLVGNWDSGDLHSEVYNRLRGFFLRSGVNIGCLEANACLEGILEAEVELALTECAWGGKYGGSQMSLVISEDITYQATWDAAREAWKSHKRSGSSEEDVLGEILELCGAEN